jgi:hypothetical protein
MALKPLITFDNAIIYTFVAVFGTIILAGTQPEFLHLTVYADLSASGSSSAHFR